MKKLFSLLLVFGLCFTLVGCGDSSESDNDSTKEKTEQKEKVYSVGETFTFKEDSNDIYKFTINSVTSTDERNEFEESNPAQVITIDYTYENLGSDDPLYVSSIDFTVIDAEGNVCSTYPLGSIDAYPQETPKGAKCTAKEAYGLIAQSSSIKLQLNTEWFDNSKAVNFELAIN